MANTTYYSPSTATAGQPATTEGIFRNTIHLHETVSVPANFATTDVAAFGYLPPGAVVEQLTLKAPTQLDSNGSPTLALNIGITGTPALFMSAITTVGRAAGASYETAMAAGGKFYKNATGAKVRVDVSPSTGAATAVAGTLELIVAYHVEEPAGSPA